MGDVKSLIKLEIYYFRKQIWALNAEKRFFTTWCDKAVIARISDLRVRLYGKPDLDDATSRNRAPSRYAEKNGAAVAYSRDDPFLLLRHLKERVLALLWFIKK